MPLTSKESTTFQLSSLDWQNYLSHRPPYPDTLYELIFAYHKNHHGNFATALNVGAGIGVATSKLLPRFDHVTLSDPNGPYLAQARRYHDGVAPSKLSFLQGTFEEMTLEALPMGKVDLIVAATCLHWMDPDEVHRAAARLLKPRGTFAAWTFGVPVTLYKIRDAASEGGTRSHGVDEDLASAVRESDLTGSIQSERYEKVSSRLQEAVRRVEARWFDLYEERIGSLRDSKSFAAKGNSHYDCFPFDARDWTDVIRLCDLVDVPLFSDRSPTAKTAVQAGETKIVLGEKEQDVAGIKLKTGFVSREGGFEDWLKMMCNWIESFDIEVSAKKEIEQVKLAMEADGVDKVRMEWPFALILASRR